MILFSQFFDKFFGLKQTNASEYNNRGNIKSICGDCSGAILDYNKAIEINPNYAQAYYNLGIAERHLKFKKSINLIDSKTAEPNPGYINEDNTNEKSKYLLGEKKWNIP